MQKVADDYRPDVIQFTEESKKVPQSLGQFESDEDARVFMSQNLLAVNTKLTAQRFMDNFEIESIRTQYSEQLEDTLPQLKEAHMKRLEELERAKNLEKEAKEMVNASLNQIQGLAAEVNERITEIELDPSNTWEVIFDGKRYYYTFIDGEIQLAKIRDIAQYELDDLISTSEKNARYFEKLKKVVNE